MADRPEGTGREFGLDYEKAKRILELTGNPSGTAPETLAEWIREARELGMYDLTPERRAALTKVAERVLRRSRGWPIPNTP